MKRFLACGALPPVSLAASARPRQQQPIFRGGSDAVRVFVTVTDRDGRLVTTLTQDNFEVRDEGKPQPITQFDNRPQPIRLVVMLDVSGSMEGNLPLLRGAAAQLFSRLLAGRRGARRRVRARGHHQPGVHARSRRARAPRCRPRSRPDAPTPLWRGDRPGAGRVRRGRRQAQGDSRAERRQGHRPDRAFANARRARPRSSIARAATT